MIAIIYGIMLLLAISLPFIIPAFIDQKKNPGNPKIIIPTPIDNIKTTKLPTEEIATEEKIVKSEPVGSEVKTIKAESVSMDYSQLCKDSHLPALGFFIRQLKTDPDFIPDLKIHDSKNRALMLLKEDISYDPDLEICNYNLQPLGYSTGDRTTPKLYSKLEKAIKVTDGSLPDFN